MLIIRCLISILHSFLIIYHLIYTMHSSIYMSILTFLWSGRWMIWVISIRVEENLFVAQVRSCAYSKYTLYIYDVYEWRTSTIDKWSWLSSRLHYLYNVVILIYLMITKSISITISSYSSPSFLIFNSIDSRCIISRCIREEQSTWN